MKFLNYFGTPYTYIKSLNKFFYLYVDPSNNLSIQFWRPSSS